MRQYKSSLLSCRRYKNKWILWLIRENVKKWNQITVGDCLSFPVSLQWFQVLVPCWAATNACLLIRGIHRDYRKTCLEIKFLRLVHPEIIIQEFTFAHNKENENQFHRPKGPGTLFATDDKQTGDTIPMPTLARRPSTEFYNAGGITAEFYGCTAKTANVGAAIRHIPFSTIILGVEDTIHKSSDFLFWFSTGCNVMDERSGDGWFIGGIEIVAIRFWKEFSKFRDAGREDCSCSEQDHPEFPVQEEGQSRGTESPERGPVSTRKTDRLHDLRLLSSDWRSWCSMGLCWFILCYSSWWQYSGIRYKMGRSSIIDDKKFIRSNLAKSVQIEDTWVWSPQKRIGIVRHGDSSKDVDAQLSKIEDNGEEKYRSETTITKLWRQARENWNRSSGQ